MKSNQDKQMILLDTSFLLPSLGIEVEKEVMETLSKLVSDDTSLFYSEWSILECSWIAIRQIKGDNYDQSLFRRGLLSITKTEVYNLIQPDPEDYLNALTLYQKGHHDMMDNLLYTTALRKQYRFLTIDYDLSRFISKNQIENIILTPEDI
ncbi:MAG: PIN domain nuclease [Candidatus Lokiarchaeota archaeon]|nr:PIN domain nuclease [Candidatus Lokiarchaeota archaeon]